MPRAQAFKPLPRSFYARPVLTVAREVIGKLLVHQTPEGLLAGRIVEAEAYRGPEDRAAHSWAGRRTARTEVMYGPPGFAYVFFVYGMHWHLNLVTTRAGAPHAVLLRAIEPLVGAELMAARRGLAETNVNLCNGPGKLCQAFDVERRHYGVDLTRGKLYLSEAPKLRGKLGHSARVGVDYAES
ncbi:MAG TPA: DNA-3-methyladenine glycosylase, partial [Polyangiaceae bacterium]|nr:DNA-3-methyladenine glycosylase [Polyangiaceae bacterium]